MLSNIRLAPKNGLVNPFCLCVNYTYLNSVAEKGVGQLRHLEEYYGRFSDNWFIVDPWSGWVLGIPMEENSIPRTAFIVPGVGSLVWNYMPLGLQGVPRTYSEFMHLVFADVVGRSLQHYLDNLDLDIASGRLGASLTAAIDAQLDLLEFVVFPRSGSERIN